MVTAKPPDPLTAVMLNSITGATVMYSGAIHAIEQHEPLPVDRTAELTALKRLYQLGIELQVAIEERVDREAKSD